MTDRDTGRRVRAVALVGLLLVSSVAGAVALVGAQTQAYEESIGGSPQMAVVDLSDASNEVTIEVSVSGDDNPRGSGELVLVRETVDASQGSQTRSFYNAGAYETVNLTVESVAGSVGFGDKSLRTSANSAGFDQWLGGTGGDKSLQCDLSDQLAGAVNPTRQNVDCQSLPGSVTKTSDDIQSNQTGLDLYMSGQEINASNQNHHDTMDGWLTDAREVAMQRGYNAYVRALNNGSSQSAAETAGKEAINQYYSNHERQIINKWNLAIDAAAYDREVDQQESTSATIAPYNFDHSLRDTGKHTWQGTGNETFTLQNGETVTYRTIEYSSGGTPYTAALTDGQGGTAIDIGYSHSSSEYDWIKAADTSRFASHLDRIENESTDAVSQLETVSQGVYQDYQEGEINNSDLVNPTMLSRQYSPGSEYQTWAAATLTSVGAGGPENLSQVGQMNLTLNDGTNVSGLLMSDGNPQSGQFDTGQTYDPANIEGAQFVVTNDRLREIKEPFTLRSTVTADGEERQNVTIQERNYETTNVTQLKQLYDEIAKTRAELEARQSALAGGGGFFGGGGGNAAIIVVAGAAVFLIASSRD